MREDSYSNGMNGESVGDGERSSFASFPTTNWSEIGRIIQSQEELARGAYGEWAASYSRPIYAYFRSKGKQDCDARDLTQGLIVYIYEKDKFKQLEPHSRLRSWLRTIADHWLVDDHRRSNSKASQTTRGVWLFSQLQDFSDRDIPIIDERDPERAFRAAWRLEVLKRALEAVRLECQSCGREMDYELFRRYYIAPRLDADAAASGKKLTWDDLAREFGLESARAASGRGDWVRKRVFERLKLEVRWQVANERDFEDEWRTLLGD